ncbi:MAG: hypothetical protein MJ198_05085 [Bacteroidales bacterium]|nr:hypothetical protein [Bacteroidales bacterium]
MNDFLSSKFMQNLKNGELPTINTEVYLSTSSMITLAVLILVVGTVLIAGNKMIK